MPIMHEEINRALITKHLVRAGKNREQIAEHLTGWDLEKRAWEEWLRPGEHLTQFVTGPSSNHPEMSTGNYFALPSTREQGSVGVGDGLAGRYRRDFLIVRPFHALWGTAASIPEALAIRSGMSLRAPGGATQIFLFDRGLTSLVAGNANRKDYGV